MKFVPEIGEYFSCRVTFAGSDFQVNIRFHLINSFHQHTKIIVGYRAGIIEMIAVQRAPVLLQALADIFFEVYVW